MRGPTSGNKLSPSPLKQNVQRYHNNQIKSRSRDASSENQFSPPPHGNSQPFSANPHKNSAALSQNETAKNNPHSERNLVEEYRQKLRSKLSETTSINHNQSQVSHSQRPQSFGLQNPNQGQASNFSAPLDTGHPLRLSPSKIQAQHEFATRLGQTTGSHQNQVMEGIRERYGNQLDHLQARVSPPPTREWNPNQNPLQYNSQVQNPLQGSSSGPSGGLKQSDNSSMQSVYNRIQNLRQSILNQDDGAAAQQPTVSNPQKNAKQAYDDFQNQLRARTPSPANGFNHPTTQLQNQQEVNTQQELSPMMYSIVDSQTGTQTKGRRRSIENSSLEDGRRQTDHSFEQKLRAEMEQQLQERFRQIEFEHQKGSEQRYQDLQQKFDNLLGQFNQLKAHHQTQEQVPQFAVAELSRRYQSSQRTSEHRQEQSSRNSEPQQPSYKVSEPKFQSLREVESNHNMSQKASSKEKVELVNSRRSSSGHHKSETHPTSGANIKTQSHKTSGNHKISEIRPVSEKVKTSSHQTSGQQISEGPNKNGPSQASESRKNSGQNIAEARQTSGNVKTSSHQTSGHQMSEFNQASGQQISDSRQTSQQLPPAPRSGRQQSSHNTSLIPKDHSLIKLSQTMLRNSSKSRQRSSSQHLMQTNTQQRSNQDIDDYTFTESEVQKMDRNNSTRNKEIVGQKDTMDTNQHRESPDHPSTKGPFSATFDQESQHHKSSGGKISQKQQRQVTKMSSKLLTNHDNSHQSSQSLASSEPKNLLSIDLMQMPQQPKPVQTYTSTHDSKTISTTPSIPLHTKRFQYKATMKMDVQQIEYQDFNKIGYFANKEKEMKESTNLKRKNMPGDKRIILELKRQVKSLNIANKKLVSQVDNTKERLLREGGQACCCQELKSVMIDKNTQMLNIIEIWKQKASEQGHFWALQVKDLHEEHQKSCVKYKGQLQSMAEQQNSVFGMIINKQEELEMQYQSKLDAKERDNRELTKRVVQHRHALVQLRLNEL